MKTEERILLKQARSDYKKALKRVRELGQLGRSLTYLRKKNMNVGICHYLFRKMMQKRMGYGEAFRNSYILMQDSMRLAGIGIYYIGVSYPCDALGFDELLKSLERRLWALDEILKLKDDE